MKSCKLRPRFRLGATLLELLVVIVILLSITAATIPSISPNVSGRQVREAARLVTIFLNAAKNRAVETGRPAGVWFERSSAVPELCDRMFFAEIPEAYAGDFLDSTIEGFMVDGGGNIINPDVSKSQRVYNVLAPRCRTGYLTDLWSNPDPKVQQLVKQGDQIKFEGIDWMYTLATLENVTIPSAQAVGASQNKWWYIIQGANTSVSTGPTGTLTGLTNAFGGYQLLWFDGPQKVPRDMCVDTNGDPFKFATAGLRYRIYRQPVKMLSGSVRLPEAAVIDLNFSSLTDSMIGTKADRGFYNSGWPFHPRIDSGDSNAASLKNPYWGDPIDFSQPAGQGPTYTGNPNYKDDTPVVLLFSPGGHVERLFCHYRDGYGYWTWQGNDPLGEIYFMIGKRDHIVPGSDACFRLSNSSSDNLNIQLQKTWLDLNSLWVKVSPQTGTISSAVIDDPGNGSTTLSLLGADNGGNTAYLGGDPSNVYTTRVKASGVRAAGGR